MDITTLKYGDKVLFGRPNGEKTLGRVLKVNRKSVKVEQLEARGQFRSYAVGTKWNLGPSFVERAPVDTLPSNVDYTANPRLSPELRSVIIEQTGRDPVENFSPTFEESVPAMEREIARLKLENAALKCRACNPKCLADRTVAPHTCGRAPAVKRPESEVLKDIRGVYAALSPENLTCDGELRGRALTRKASALRTKLAGLFRELGRRVSEDEAYRSGPSVVGAFNYP